ncbi:MAG: DUF6444 domain-containing protein [Nodosilinea sp.]
MLGHLHPSPPHQTSQPPSDLSVLEIDPEEQGARYWYARYCEQRAETKRLRQWVKELEEQFESLNEKLRKRGQRTSETSSQPPSSDGPKKPNRDKRKLQQKRGPKYNHPGTTRHGFGWIIYSSVPRKLDRGLSIESLLET